MNKFLIYVLASFFVTWSMSGVNINAIFKKNEVYKANVFYFIIILCLTYLLGSFLYDFIYIKLF